MIVGDQGLVPPLFERRTTGCRYMPLGILQLGNDLAIGLMDGGWFPPWVEVATSIADFREKILPARAVEVESWSRSSREGLVFGGTHATEVGDSGQLGIRGLVTDRYLA
jgi:hypothetical protein